MVNMSQTIQDHPAAGSSCPLNTELPEFLTRTQNTARLGGEFTKEDVEKFGALCSRRTDPKEYPLADAIERSVPIYSGSRLRSAFALPAEREELMAELHRCLLHGPGVYVVRNMVDDLSVINRAEYALEKIVEEEKRTSAGKGDHFAPAGANDRIWNSFQKFAMVDPEGFAEYYTNEALALACESWLGPGYAVTSQTNIVKPGGKAQEPHRDYHLGFQDEQTASRFPIVSQIASQLLTLQGAVAHSDMPLASGPTQLLPFSQHLDNGYVAYRHRPFSDIFRRSMIQLELATGDGLFFNPALFHAAGDNVTADHRRSANLLQVSACWGKPMETVNRKAILEKIWPAVQKLAPEWRDTQVQALLQAVCEGYSFPTNLDKDPPSSGGHCPATQLECVSEGVQQGWDLATLSQRLEAMEEKRST